MKYRLYLLAAAVLWSTGGAAFKLCALSAWQMSAARSLVAGLFLLALFPSARKFPGPRMWLVCIAYGATTVLFVVANKLTTSANAIFLQDTAPLHVLWMSMWFLKEKPTRGELIAIPLFLGGLSLFFLDRLDGGRLLGNLIALASGISFAGTIVGVRKLGATGLASIAWGNILGGAVVLPLAFSGPTPTLHDAAILGYLGVFQLGLSYVCFARGVAGTPSVETSLLVLLEPVLNPIWAYLFAGEKPGPWALTGGIVILLATLWRALTPSRPAPARETANSPA